MKRLAILVAALAACVLLTACADKPIDKLDDFAEEFNEPKEEETTDGYYIEEMNWITTIDDFVQTIHHTQYFNKVGNDMIYNPCLDSNLEYGWIWFDWYCKHDTTPILHITGDSIIYDVLHSGPCYPNEYPVAKVHFEDGCFVFSYTLTQSSECIHTCTKISNLPN